MTRFPSLGLAALLALACAPLARAQGPEGGPQSITITITITGGAAGAVTASPQAGLLRPRPRPTPRGTDVQEGARAYYLNIPTAYRQAAAQVRGRQITHRDQYVGATDQGQRAGGAAFKKAMNAVLDGYCDAAGNITNPEPLAQVSEAVADAMEAAR